MRVLQLAPLWEPVPPPSQGGTEAVVAVLCEELARRGVDVALCASGDSRTSAQLHAVSGRSLGTASDIADPSPYEWIHVALSLSRAGDYDLIHNHAGELAMAMSHLTDVPMLTTVHNPITRDARFVWDRYEGWYNTISHAQRATLPEVRSGRFAGVVHNAIDVESFPFSSQKDDYLLFLSRICWDKGVHLAIEAAKRLAMPLVIAGRLAEYERDYFREQVEPFLDGKEIVFVGEADAGQKRDLFVRARCLLLPLCWEEPFGLVMTEAMACGTPVVAFARGAAPEIVRHGETGFLVDEWDGVDGLVAAVLHVSAIDPASCRRHVEENFSPSSMVDRYVDVYEKVLANAPPELEMVPTTAVG